jgi:hypothetical protein
VSERPYCAAGGNACDSFQIGLRERPCPEGECSVRPLVAGQDVEAQARALAEQIAELAKVLMEEFGGPTRSEGAVDMAIRLLREQRAAQAEAERETLTWRRMVDSERERTAAAERRAQAAEAIALGGKLCISQQHADLERRAQEAEHGIARWEVYAQGLEAQVRSAREALRMLMSNAMAILRETGGHRGLAHTSRVSMELAIDFARSALSSSPVSSPERKE